MGIGDGDWRLGIGDWAQSPFFIFKFKYMEIFKYYNINKRK